MHWVRSDAPLDRHVTRQPRKACCATATPYRGPAGAAKDQLTLVVAPRLGTVSPWASKATDIAHNCGLPIRRVERVTEYALTLKSGLLGGVRQPDAEQLAALAALLHDRMTESVLPNREAARHLFDEQPAQAMVRVDILAGGRAKLVAANTEFGLALSDDEIDYLVAAFQRACSATPAMSS